MEFIFHSGLFVPDTGLWATTFALYPTWGTETCRSSSSCNPSNIVLIIFRRKMLDESSNRMGSGKPYMLTLADFSRDDCQQNGLLSEKQLIWNRRLCPATLCNSNRLFSEIVFFPSHKRCILVCYSERQKQADCVCCVQRVTLSHCRGVGLVSEVGRGGKRQKHDKTIQRDVRRDDIERLHSSLGDWWDWSLWIIPSVPGHSPQAIIHQVH